jgi:hypothetical protein
MDALRFSKPLQQICSAPNSGSFELEALGLKLGPGGCGGD